MTISVAPPCEAPMSDIQEIVRRLEEECERLRKLDHDAPLNKVFTTHNSARFLGSHSTAWADRSREWVAATDRLALYKALQERGNAE